MKIKINCQGADEKAIDELKDFQGELKSISKAAMMKLKNNIKRNGFSAPVFVWQKSQKSKAYIIDGHQRIKALRELAEDGHEIPERLPVDYIKAKSKADAKRLLLGIVSQFGKVKQKGFDLFIEGLNLEDLNMEINIPQINIRPDVVKPEVEISGELLESHNYVVLYFDNDIDWLQAQTVLGLSAVRSKHSKLKQIGIGRVLKGADVIQRLANAE